MWQCNECRSVCSIWMMGGTSFWILIDKNSMWFSGTKSKRQSGWSERRHYDDGVGATKFLQFTLWVSAWLTLLKSLEGI
jgi:hypothetical protein